jgi:serine/threonine-protein kinase RsbW
MTMAAGDIRVMADDDQLQVTARPAGEVLSDLRRTIREFLDRHAAAPDLIADVELAASELATNVIRHTASDSIGLSIARADRGWRLDVADAERVPSLDGLALPPPSQPTGRGLLVVAAVMDEVMVVDVDGTHVVRCFRFER